MTDRLPESGKIMKEGLCLRAELVLVGLPEMPPIERREVRARLKGGKDEAAVWVQHPVPFLQCGEWRRHIGE